ncbi:transposase, partial [Candidatus Hakubella thermalkaliphila]
SGYGTRLRRQIQLAPVLLKTNLRIPALYVYSLQFHHVACVKYRHKALNEIIAKKLKSINLDAAKAFGVEIIEQETAIDHIHISFPVSPDTAFKISKQLKLCIRKVIIPRVS